MPETLVLGLGNPLVGDEGFGVEAVQRLTGRYRFPSEVDVVDGGTLGLRLLPMLEDADRVIILDAVDVGADPGALVELDWHEVRRALPVKISPHQETVSEVLALLELRRGAPERFRVVGVQPERLEFAARLSPAVEAGLERALARVVEILSEWGSGPTAGS